MKVELLTPDRRAEAIAVLVPAFYDYETMHKFINDETHQYEHKLNAIIGYLCEVNFLLNNFIFAVVDDGEVVAAALVGIPENIRIPNDISKKIQAEDDRLQGVIGIESFQLLESYEDITDRHRPDYPHYYIDTIGVHPSREGRGYAKVLLNKVRDLAMENQNCNTACLFTESTKNVLFYEHMGYRVFAESDFNSLHTWGMMIRV